MEALAPVSRPHLDAAAEPAGLCRVVNLPASPLREDLDLTQADMARLLNVHQTTYSDYELGRLDLPIGLLRRLAVYFGVSADYIIGLTDEQRPYPRKKQTK